MSSSTSAFVTTSSLQPPVTSTSSTPRSTFWIIDTTSISDTFTTTATFTLWVPLDTTSTTPTPFPTTIAATPSQTSSTSSRTAIIIGSVVGCSIIAALVALLCFIYRMKRARPQFRLHQTDTSSKGLDSAPSSSHALLDLAAEPTPHPTNIEPWVAPTAVRRPGKIRPRDDPTEHEDTRDEAPGQEPQTSLIDPPQLAASSHHEVPPPRPAAARTLHLVQHESIGSTSTLPISHNPKSSLPMPQPRRRRTQREPSPPRLEEDAGVSLMRAGDEAPSPLADEPPSYNFASGSGS
ncbi:hypothetical protein FRC07_009807 [Ceratobasidium sp. 392]|nr:hypothetical protein FRC07_009807 [Ceratobasidium sp. 392]